MAARSLSPIPAGSSIVESIGTITTFFRLRWQELVDTFLIAPIVGSIQRGAPSPPSLTAALATTTIFTTLTAGLYEIGYYYRRTGIDGVSSSLQATVGWTENGVALTETAAANTNDSVTTGQQSGSKVVWADANTDLTIAIAYASNTPNLMAYRLDAWAALKA